MNFIICITCPYCCNKFIIPAEEMTHVDNQFVIECPHCEDIIYTESLNLYAGIDVKEIFTE